MTSSCDSVLVWGLAEDAPVAAVLRELARTRQSFFFLDQSQVTESALRASGGADAASQLVVRGEVHTLERTRSVYLRPQDTTQLAAVRAAGEGSAVWCDSLLFDRALLEWCDSAPGPVLTRPSAAASNASKPYQLSLIRAHGMSTPETLVTTDPQAVRRFWEEHRQVIYKSVSGVRSIVSRLNEAHLDRLPDVGSCPTQFQRWIPGVDHRVHVVGEEIFASRIEADVDDYRYASSSARAVSVVACEVPVEVGRSCLELSRNLQLPLAGIDFRVDGDGTWWCFEVNPSPGFTFYEAHTGQPITRAVARLLAGGT